MGKGKSITLIVILLLITVFFGVFAFVPVQLGLTDYLAPINNISLGIELSGGVSVVYECVSPEKDGEPIYSGAQLSEKIPNTVEILKSRLSAAGYSESTVVAESGNRIRVEVAENRTSGIDTDDIFNIIGKPAILEFRDPDSNVILSGAEGDIVSAQAQYITGTGWAVVVWFSSSAQSKWADATANLVGKSISIYLDNEEISSPTVQEAMSGNSATISGSFTQDYAKSLATQIQGGSLTVDLKVLSTSTISATLGSTATTTGLIAAGIGLLLVFIFMIVFYKGMGLIADIALIIYIVVVVFILGSTNLVQLSLAGIAGIILSIGMAVDANIIIFERIKDEYRGGKTLLSSYQSGFKRASVAVIDANVTTLIAAVAILIFGSATIKSFAITLIIGIIISFITAMLITRLFLKLFINVNKNPKFYGLKRSENNIDNDIDNNVTLNQEGGILNEEA